MTAARRRTRPPDAQNRLARRTVVFAAVWVLILHVVLQELRFPIFVLGPLDWSAHIATAVLLLANLPIKIGPAFTTAALVAAIAIDLDHVPGFLGSDVLSEGTPRPYPHSLATVLLLAGAGARLRGRAGTVLLGLAFGVLAHLLRDIATGDGIPLLWPLTQVGVQIPFWIEAAAIGALATRAWHRGALGN
jgi:inner membrane protein